MLNLIKSNKIELLTEVLAEELLINPPSVTENIDISVSDYLLGNWMKDQITIKNRISSLYEFKSINSYTENLIKKFYPENILDSWNSESLIWVVLNSLGEVYQYKESWPLHYWLQKYDQKINILDKDLYILSNKIARIFSDYMLFRPEMINNWHLSEIGEKGLFNGLESSDYWQPILFKIIEKKIGFRSVPFLIIDFLNNFDSQKLKIKEKIPDQIYLLVINNLSRLQLSFYLQISQLTRVNIYQLSYGYDLWGRLNIEQGTIFRKDEDLNLDNIERIFGRYGSDFEKLFDETVNNLQIDINYKPFYSNPENMEKSGSISLLLQLQKKIIDDNNKKIKYFSNDESFQFSGQYDIIHELEFVKDKIINFIENDKEIKYSDIMIVTPSIENIVPFIKSVFDDEFINGQSIPYILSNKKYYDVSNVFRFLNEYLELASSKVTIQKLNSLLSDDFVKNIFKLSSKDVEEVLNILEDSGFDWGIDAKERSGEFMNTLDWCIQRITLGMLYDDEFFLEKNNISSFSSNNFYIDLHKCVNILIQIKRDINSLRGLFNFREWINKIKTILQNLRYKNSFYNEEINEMNIILDKLLKQVDCNNLMDIYLVKEILFKNINKPNNIYLNRNNQVLIGDINTIRLIPHKIIFLINMNNRYFPKKFIDENINLINKFFIFGDISKINKEKYLFLELFMSCRKKLLITWSNYDKKNDKLEIATPIKHLIYYLKTILEEGDINKIVNNINPNYFLDLSEAKNNKNNNKYSLISKIDWKLIENKTKNYKLSEIIYWFGKPQLYWLRKNNLSFARRFINNKSDENINGFQKSKLLNDIIKNIKLENPNLENAINNINIKKFLIHNGIYAPGNSLNLKETEIRIILYSLLEKINKFKLIDKISIKKGFNKEEYFVCNDQIIELINSNLNISKLSEFWIRLLFASSINTSIKSTKIIFRTNNQYKIKEIISPGTTEAKQLLSNYIDIYTNSATRCWPIPPESSFYFVEAMLSQKNEQNAFINSWVGMEGFKDGERNKPEMEFCFGEGCHPDFFINNDNFINLSSKIYSPLVKSLYKNK